MVAAVSIIWRGVIVPDIGFAVLVVMCSPIVCSCFRGRSISARRAARDFRREVAGQLLGVGPHQVIA